MEKLTTKEEEIMLVLWRLKSAFVKELIDEMTEPKPHYNTVSTTIRILEEKGFVQHKTFGKSHQYSAIISQNEYQDKYLGGIVDRYFGNSYKSLVSFFAKEEQLSKKDLLDIIQQIENSGDE